MGCICTNELLPEWIVLEMRVDGVTGVVSKTLVQLAQSFLKNRRRSYTVQLSLGATVNLKEFKIY